MALSLYVRQITMKYKMAYCALLREFVLVMVLQVSHMLHSSLSREGTILGDN